MPDWVAALIKGIAIVGSALLSKKSSDDSRQDNRKWRQRAVDLQEQMYEEGREDQRPYRELGYNAIANLEDPDAYTKSPGYQFRIDEGTRNRENQYSMRGGGGNAMRAMEEYAQNFASNDYYNYRNDQRANAGLGQAATTATGQMGMNYGNQGAYQYGQIGDNLASIGLWNSGNQANALTQAGTGISNLLYSNKNGKGYLDNRPKYDFQGREITYG